MIEAQHRLRLHRLKGGFREMLETELGAEQLCRSCGESWPADKEFYVVTPTTMGYECKACTTERRGPRRAPEPPDVYADMSRHLNRIAHALRLLV